LLVFANKQDHKGALNAAQVSFFLRFFKNYLFSRTFFVIKKISEAMGLSEIRNRQWSIKETTATKGSGLFEGFDW
jgi:ADP-ribosylation factor-like protein 1